MNKDLKVTVEGVEIKGDHMKAILVINGLTGEEISTYEMKRRVLEVLEARLAEDWLRDNYSKLLSEIDINKVVNQVLLLVSRRAMGDR